MVASASGRSFIRIAMIDGDVDLRTMWRRCFARQAHLKVVGEANDCREVMELVGTVRPDVVLLDVDALHPEMNGLAAARVIRENTPETKIIFMATDIASPELHDGELADAYLSRGALPQELADTVEAIFEAGDAASVT